jgi:lysophospholipase L1-like esterase
MATKIFFVVAFLVGLVLMSFTKAGTKKRVVFFGDSITEQGAKAGGYITKIDSLIKADVSNPAYDLLGAGISGNKVYDLYLRIEDDVLNKSPQVTVVYIGVNDVWHKTKRGTGTDIDKFEAFYKAIIRKLLAVNSKVIVCTPAVIGEKKDCTNEQDGDLNRYCNVIRNLAKEYNVSLVDLRQIFMDYYAQHNPDNKDKDILTTDGVHLNVTGNLLVAEHMWKAIKALP